MPRDNASPFWNAARRRAPAESRAARQAACCGATKPGEELGAPSRCAAGRRLQKLGVACLAIALMTLGSPAWAGGKSAWSEVREAVPGRPQSIGGYSSGCVRGASPLPPQGIGYQLMRPKRHRHFGHPKLVGFIQRLGTKMHGAKLEALAVGDLGQPRGGPAPGGHASHQSGLDVDLWYAPPGPQHRSMVAEAENALSKHYSPRVGAMLKLASTEPRVARIFVNPVIKKALCASEAGDRKWLRKLRAWWGHDEHFHVRLACPEGSPKCTPQAPLPAGDGCGELGWWLDARKAKARNAGVKQYAKRIRSKPKLPQLCQALVKAGAPGSSKPAKETRAKPSRKTPARSAKARRDAHDSPAQ